MIKFKFIEIAPQRSIYDELYLSFINTITKEIIYRKALNWGNKK